MKVLGITSRLPYPLTDGARICMFQAVQGLVSNGHEVHLVAIEEEGCDPGPLTDMARVHVVPHKPAPKVLGALGTLFRSRPYTQLKKEVKGVYGLLDGLQAEEGFDAVYSDQSHIAQYGAYVKERYGLPYLFRSHNVEHEIYRRHTDTVRNPFMKAYLELQYKRWRRFEVDQMRRADVCAAITERDRETILKLLPGSIVETIPAAVDLRRFAFTGVDEREENSVILLGGMGWEPNKDAAIWFANDILPLIRQQIPETVCYLVGESPPLSQLPPASEHFCIEGYVESILPYYGTTAVGLIPLRVGGGMRVKLGEMMSSGMPVVSTGLGAEGNVATPGRHYLRADTAAEFAAATVRLLKNREERRRLSEEGRRFVEERYSMEEIGRRYERLFALAMERADRKKAEMKQTAGMKQKGMV